MNGPIEPDKPIDTIRPEPYSLPDGFHWDTLNIDDDLVLKELYTLLNENYVEDEDSMFRFDYPPDFLKWLFLYNFTCSAAGCFVKRKREYKTYNFCFQGVAASRLV